MDILTISPDDPLTCPICGTRLETDGVPVDEDDDGPIYVGECPLHGAFRWQIDSNE